MIGSAWHVSVLIPARDEEALLPRCLRSIEAARRMLPPLVTSDVVVVSDCSTDGTVRIARTMLGEGGAVLETEAGCVGQARGLAARAGLRRAGRPWERCWLANTDADCEVPPGWLTHQLSLAETGFGAVAGIVDVDTFEEHDAVVPERFHQTYMIHPDGTHPHVHGANLGVRADAYMRAGGWNNLATAEDHDLWGRLRAAGVRQIADASFRVTTSGRRIGRAPSGFAEALAAHNVAGQNVAGQNISRQNISGQNVGD